MGFRKVIQQEEDQMAASILWAWLEGNQSERDSSKEGEEKRWGNSKGLRPELRVETTCWRLLDTVMELEAHIGL